MANYTRQDGGAMQRDAQRRAQQMQQRVPYRRQGSRNGMQHMAPDKPPEQEQKQEPLQNEEQPQKEEKTAAPRMQLPFGIGGGLDQLLEHIDTDRMLIIALLAMLYKDGSSKKLMMALAYLLT